MRLHVRQIPVKLDYAKRDVLVAVSRLLGCRVDELSGLVVRRRSIDARGRGAPPHYVLSVEIDYYGTTDPPSAPGRIERMVREEPAPSPPRPVPRKRRPIVVGAGPAGLMAALTLAEAGWKPLLVERGSGVGARTSKVEAFWREGTLDQECNVLYGEGGAGLFSDGKLTSRTKDRGAVRHFLDVLVDCGASPDILIDAESHLGTDMLRRIIPALRGRIEEAGGRILFDNRLDGLLIESGTLRGVTVSNREIATDNCFLATGHSARDVYGLLLDSGVELAAKPFAVGVRAEMPQSRLNTAQYGRWAHHPRLGSAGFRLTRRPEASARACYSFCTCPGGLVMACASSDGLLTTNGMSYSSRAKPFGNAAFLVPVGPKDFTPGGGSEALAGVSLQRALEEAAFRAGGGDYGLPAQPLEDFLEGTEPQGIPEARSCARAVPADVRGLLPDEVARTLCSALPKMLRQLSGVRLDEVLLYGIETRSSSPVRIAREPTTLQSTSVSGLYPIGEGAGYAGGIVSSALDGLAAARRALAIAAGTLSEGSP